MLYLKALSRTESSKANLLNVQRTALGTFTFAECSIAPLDVQHMSTDTLTALCSSRQLTGLPLSIVLAASALLPCQCLKNQGASAMGDLSATPGALQDTSPATVALGTQNAAKRKAVELVTRSCSHHIPLPLSRLMAWHT